MPIWQSSGLTCAWLLIDASVGITEQDEKIAGIAHEAGKATIIVVNKWDTVEKDNGTVKAFTDRIRTSLAYMPYAPIVFVSVKTGQRVDNLYDLIKSVYEQANRRINTGALNDVLGEAMMRVQPPTDKGRRLKDLLHDAVLRGAAHLRAVLQRRGAVPFLLSALH